MNIFQLVFITFCALQAILALRRFVRTRQVTAIVFTAAWTLATLLLVYPVASTRIANIVGIGRGVDFITYSLLVVFLWAHYQQYLRYKLVENEVTMLVRELAVSRASRPDSLSPVDLGNTAKR